MEEVVKPQNALDTVNERKDNSTARYSRSDIIRKRNQAVKIAMAQELSSQGLPEEVIRRVLHFEEEH